MKSQWIRAHSKRCCGRICLSAHHDVLFHHPYYTIAECILHDKWVKLGKNFHATTTTSSCQGTLMAFQQCGTGCHTKFWPWQAMSFGYQNWCLNLRILTKFSVCHWKPFLQAEPTWSTDPDVKKKVNPHLAVLDKASRMLRDPAQTFISLSGRP